MNRKRNKIAWLMWALMIITYMFNTFHAVAMGVIRQDLIDAFTLSEGEFVLLTNAFSYAYMFMQIPAGIFLDKIGAKKIACLGNLTAASGTLIFSMSSHFQMLVLGRALIGLGCSVCFLSVLKICAEWFEDRIFCTMSGVTCFVGMMGAMAAQSPLALLNTLFSWRKIFLGIAEITCVSVILILLFVKNSPKEMELPQIHDTESEQTKISVCKAVISVLKNARTWPPFIAYGCFYGTYLLLSGIYGTSMIVYYYQTNTVIAAGSITFAVLGCAVGSLVIGALADYFKNRRFTQVITGICFIVGWLILLFTIGKVNLVVIDVIMFMIGFTSCAYSVCWSCVKESNHPDYVGISTSVANIGGYLGSIIVPTIISSIYTMKITQLGEMKAYENVMISAIIVNIIGVIFAWFVKETRGKNIYGK